MKRFVLTIGFGAWTSPGCVPVNTINPENSVFFDDDPTIVALDYSCDSDDGQWAFQFQTSGWTGGGRVFMARSADSIEQHKLFSAEAAANGDWDCLIETLSISEDWTLAQTGTSTRWLCSDLDELSFMVQVDTANGSSIADCAVWGANPGLWENVDELTPCTDFLQPGGQKTDTGSVSWYGECDG